MKQLSIFISDNCYQPSDGLGERVESVGHTELAFVGNRLLIFRLQ